MPAFGGEVPFGIDDLKVKVLTADTPGTAIDLPGARTLEFNVEQSKQELNGDNQVLYIQTFAKKLTGSIELAQYNQAGLAAMTGGVVTTTGTTPNQVSTYTEPATPGAHYFQAIGQAAANDGGAFRLTLLKLKVTGGPNVNMSDSAFSTPKVSIDGVALAGNLYKIEAYETSTPIS